MYVYLFTTWLSSGWWTNMTSNIIHVIFSFFGSTIYHSIQISLLPTRWPWQVPSTENSHHLRNQPLGSDFSSSANKYDMMTTGQFSDIIENSHTMMTSSNGNIFRVIGPLCGHWRFFLTKASQFPFSSPILRWWAWISNYIHYKM